MLLQFGILIVGFVVLVKGADWLVNGASALAKKNNVSDLAIGLTIVAFGTSAPELVVSVISAIQGKEEIVLGNVIGSNNFNLLLILGISGLIIPLVVQKSTVWKEIPISMGAALLLFLFGNNFFLTTGDFMVSRFEGIILLICFAGFLFYVYKQMKTNNAAPLDIDEKILQYSNLKIWFLIIIGLVGLIVGGKFVVDSAVKIAKAFNVSEKIIGLTIVAIGTSLPELATSMVAAFKKKMDIAVGNIIGSNIFNVFLIVSVSSIITPIKFNQAFNTDLYILFGGTLFLFAAMFIGKKFILKRYQAAIMLAAYIAYTVILIMKEI
jgi:cation:H+ antiporter